MSNVLDIRTCTVLFPAPVIIEPWHVYEKSKLSLISECMFSYEEQELEENSKNVQLSSLKNVEDTVFAELLQWRNS